MNNKYYRITYYGEGIYNALKNNVGKEIWQELLLNSDISWLPKPPTYSSKNISYFTEKGYEKFLNRTMPIISSYLKKENINVDILVKIPDLPIYLDEYQVVVDNNK